MKIVGNTVGMGLPKPNLMQNDPVKGDYVEGKEDFLKQVQVGATAEQAKQIAKNKEDIENLTTKKLDADELPKKLPNPNKLTFTGAVEAEYDGSKEVTVEIPKGGNGGGIEVTGAEVGQTIVVKAVDENGKPTEWECAELPSSEVWRKLADINLSESAASISVNKDIDGNDFSCKKILLFGKFCQDVDNAVKEADIYLNNVMVAQYCAFVMDTGRSCGSKIWIDASQPYVDVTFGYTRNQENRKPQTTWSLSYFKGRVAIPTINSVKLTASNAAYPFNADTIFEVWGVDA